MTGIIQEEATSHYRSMEGSLRSVTGGRRGHDCEKKRGVTWTVTGPRGKRVIIVPHGPIAPEGGESSKGPVRLGDKCSVRGGEGLFN